MLRHHHALSAVAFLVLASCSPAQVLGQGAASPDEGARTATRPLPAGDHARSLEVGGSTRSYAVHVPEGERPAAGWPTVIGFHGNFMDGAGFAAMSRIHELGAKEGFAVVYPDGTGVIPTARSWNAGPCCLEASLRGIDDVSFGGALLDAVERELPADPDRIYLVGFSNGGMLTYRLLDEYADRVAGAAMVAAVGFATKPAPSRAVPLLHIHGTADPYVPYRGNRFGFRVGFPRMPPVRDRLERWVKAYGGEAAKPTTRKLPGDAAHITHGTWAATPGGAEVQLYALAGSGHSWPGGPRFATEVLGEPDPHLDATKVIWEFLRRHRRAPAAAD